MIRIIVKSDVNKRLHLWSREEFGEGKNVVEVYYKHHGKFIQRFFVPICLNYCLHDIVTKDDNVMESLVMQPELLYGPDTEWEHVPDKKKLNMYEQLIEDIAKDFYPKQGWELRGEDWM